jgi:hypothetical protein
MQDLKPQQLADMFSAKLIDDTDLVRFNKLSDNEGDGSYCCGKRMTLAPSGIVFECLKCGNWEYSSS